MDIKGSGFRVWGLGGLGGLGALLGLGFIIYLVTEPRRSLWESYDGLRLLVHHMVWKCKDPSSFEKCPLHVEVAGKHAWRGMAIYKACSKKKPKTQNPNITLT